MRAGERKDCAACGVKLIGALNPKTGKVAPIEVDEHPDGNVFLHSRALDLESVMTVCAWTMGADTAEKAREAGVGLRMNHFATCPSRRRFERK